VSASRTSPGDGDLLDPASLEDIALAYRLVLKRDPDPGGFAHYASRLSNGLSLDDVLRELLQSEERRSRLARLAANAAAVEPHANRQPPAERADASLVDPAEVIRSVPLSELNRTADAYFTRVTDPLPLLQKPFAFLHETPEMLENLGSAFRGLELGKTMTVLDFGGGTGWLSRLLAQLNCRAICCDVSPAALDLGRRLFREYPPIGRDIIAPTFLEFDGVHIDLPDASVDRIISFDAFHHVPNQEQVVSEFGRILRPGGIVAFSEPGPHHSRSPQSQFEMRNHNVLENDIDLVAISKLARRHGLTDGRVRIVSDSTLSIEEYEAALDEIGQWRTRDSVVNSVRRALFSRSIFFLDKGPRVYDSRGHVGLMHQLTVSPRTLVRDPSGTVTLSITAKNVGSAKWLHENVLIHGTVRLGSHLLDSKGRLLEVDHSRHGLPRSIEPGQEVSLNVTVPVPAVDCQLEFDLVSEGVRWFENEGARPVRVVVEAR
jgi:SAM-dependent methyltransferase